jgi:hypothetical protein
MRKRDISQIPKQMRADVLPCFFMLQRQIFKLENYFAALETNVLLMSLQQVEHHHTAKFVTRCSKRHS